MKRLGAGFSLWCLCVFASVPAARAADLPDFTGLVKEVAPAVVNVSTTQKVSTGGSAASQLGIPDLDDLPPFFRQLFERGMPRRPQQREVRSLGSGFIISPDGYILTNNHVVKSADEIMVRLSDRRELKAKVVGADARSDLALLKVNAKNLPTVKMDKNDDLQVGEWVVAIGSPFGFDHSVTAGIVSATDRSVPDSHNENYVPFIQTDVAINPGNSGGPLFNMKGEVVGINSQIYTRSGGYMGVSFAIPIDVALNVSEQLKSTGKVDRGWLGVVVQEVNKDLAESFGLERPVGALVAQVKEGGPADKGGLKVGDIIMAVNGKQIEVSADLPHIVGAMKSGTKATFDTIREGRRRSLILTVGAIPSDAEDEMLGSSSQGKASNKLGVTVGSLTDEQKKQMDLSGGVIIRDVQDGPAAAIGLRPGDVITHLNNHQVNSVADFAKIDKSLPKDRPISLRVLRGGRASFITFKLGD